jgi:hypothetical protein
MPKRKKLDLLRPAVDWMAAAAGAGHSGAPGATGPGSQGGAGAEGGTSGDFNVAGRCGQTATTSIAPGTSSTTPPGSSMHHAALWDKKAALAFRLIAEIQADEDDVACMRDVEGFD